MDIPAMGPDGRRITVLNSLSDDERVWYFRSAWNVAALNCTDPLYTPVLDGYSSYIKNNAKVLKQVNDRIDASYRKEYNVRRDAIKARETTMTTVYNYFALPPARGGFCTAALDVANRAAALPDLDPVVFAQANLTTMEQPFEDFFTAYEKYQRASADWDARYGSRYGSSQPGYVAVQKAQASMMVPSAGGISDPSATTANPLAESKVIDQTTGAQIPVVPVNPNQQSTPVVQPIPDDAPGK